MRDLSKKTEDLSMIHFLMKQGETSVTYRKGTKEYTTWRCRESLLHTGERTPAQNLREPLGGGEGGRKMCDRAQDRKRYGRIYA